MLVAQGLGHDFHLAQIDNQPGVLNAGAISVGAIERLRLSSWNSFLVQSAGHRCLLSIPVRSRNEREPERRGRNSEIRRGLRQPGHRGTNRHSTATAPVPRMSCQSIGLLLRMVVSLLCKRATQCFSPAIKLGNLFLYFKGGY